MKDKADKKTLGLLLTQGAKRQADYAARHREQGRRQRTFWLTDEEFEKVRMYIEFQRSEKPE